MFQGKFWEWARKTGDTLNNVASTVGNSVSKAGRFVGGLGITAVSAVSTVATAPLWLLPGTDAIWFIYGGSSIIGLILNGNSYYFRKNLQGDVLSILDSYGATVVSYVYDSWGKLISTTGTMASTLGVKNPIRYRSYYYDTETNLYYLNSRYYDPEIKRFVNADGLTESEGSYYSYCNGNPVVLTDSTGMAPFFDKIGQWFKNTFGFAVYAGKSIGYSEKYDYFLGGYEVGVEAGYGMMSGTNDKAINFFVLTPAEKYKFWEYKIGVETKGNVGIDITLGLQTQSISVNVGMTSYSLFHDFDSTKNSNSNPIPSMSRIGFEVSNQLNYGFMGERTYTSYYINPTQIQLAAVAVIACVYYPQLIPAISGVAGAIA